MVQGQEEGIQIASIQVIISIFQNTVGLDTVR